jgi:hypothetical protein
MPVEYGIYMGLWDLITIMMMFFLVLTPVNNVFDRLKISFYSYHC